MGRAILVLLRSEVYIFLLLTNWQENLFLILLRFFLHPHVCYIDKQILANNINDKIM